MMQYEMPSYAPDNWDLAKALTLMGTLASLLGLLVSSDSKLKRTLGIIGAYLGVARALVHVTEPPRCQVCCARSLRSDTLWHCPNGHGITGAVGWGEVSGSTDL